MRGNFNPIVNLILYKKLKLPIIRNTMPALSPPASAAASALLTLLGQRIRDHRKALSVSATDAAEASGISRVTLHRIERGEPSVAMASYMNAIAALGLELEITRPQTQRQHPAASDHASPIPSTLRLADYPQLKRLAWQRGGTAKVSPEEALSLYERNWRHVDMAAMDPHERALVAALAQQWGGGRLLV